MNPERQKAAEVEVHVISPRVIQFAKTERVASDSAHAVNQTYIQRSLRRTLPSARIG